MTRSAIEDPAARLRKRTGIGHFTPHVLRHSRATRLLRARVPIEVVAELPGHSSSPASGCISQPAATTPGPGLHRAHDDG
ncbi:tyrosine-type recombinase/integrase [Streptomyces sp. NBC_01224]|uniref:tyrosine-type recombinase/integrase n=1 Tax=unclassified Streptomyces TaxID=2593676 RepID=UPI002E0E8BFB|nr:tyrosine-type recombinase/integrase [Streptomyces sp. NBC_01224]